MADSPPWKIIFLAGFLLGAVVAGAVTYDPGDAGAVSDGVSFGAPDGANVTLEGDTNLPMETDVLFPSSDTVALKTEAGNVSFSSSGPTWATIDTSNITGTWTNVTGIDATGTDLTVDPADKRAVTLGKQIDHIAFRDGGIDDNQVDFTYGGSSGESTVTLRGLQANTQIGAVDASSNALLDVATSDGAGTVTFDALPNSDHKVTLVTSSGGPSLDDGSMDPDGDIERTESVTLSIDLSDPDLPSDNVTLEWYVDNTKQATTYATSAGTHTTTVGPLSDGDYDWRVVATDGYGQQDTSATKSFTIQHYTPQIDNIQPTGKLQTPPSQVSADITDRDFPIDGDTLTVEIILDGSTLDTQTLNSNGSVSTSIPSSGQTGGEHNVTIVADDDWGNSNVGSTTYQVPDTLYIRNETDHSQLVPADGSVRFFGDGDDVYERSAPSGTVDMTNLPVDQPFIVEVEPTDPNYTDRVIYIDTIYEQQSAYVLNTNVYATIESRFVLDDPTGIYDSESLLKIQRPIEIGGSLTYQTIIADEFGTEGVTATLQADQRYELRVESDREAQPVGPYRADVGETVEVQPGTPTVGLGDQAFENGWAAAATLDNDTLEYRFSDPTQNTDKLVVWIHERNNESNQLQANQTYLQIGNVSDVVSLTKSQTETEWVVEFVVDRNGETFVDERILSNQRNLTPPISGQWQVIIGVGLLFLFAGAFSVLNAAIGAVVVSLVGGVLWYIGYLGDATTAAAVVIALFISVVAYMYKGAR